MPQPLENLRQIRLEKLKKLRDLGVDPYPATWKFGDWQKRSSILEVRDKKQGAAVITAGRLMGLRSHGKLTFADLRDETGQIQLAFKQNLLPATCNLLPLLDIGDFLGAAGKLFTTAAGELTIEVSDFQILAKSLRSLPSEFFGLEDTETRYRQRYLDLLLNPEVKKRFKIRSQLTKEIRNFLNNCGFLEMETPTLQPLYGGANAQPFTTHHNALDAKFYLRIADELYLKRLVVGGFEKVYEICKDFRNEGLDQTHNPEFTMIEIYQAFTNYQQIMDLTEELFKYLAATLFREPTLQVLDKKIDIGKKWPRVTLKEIIQQRLNLNVEKASDEELFSFCEKNNLEILKGANRGLLIFNIFEHLVTDQLIEPTWVIDYPVEVSPLAKSHPQKKGLVERFEGYVGGKEICDGWSEINDPLEQGKRFRADQKLARRKDEKPAAHPLDEDFIKAMEYGMPPLGGIGIGIDRLTMFFTNTWSIKEVILFPTLRPI